MSSVGGQGEDRKNIKSVVDGLIQQDRVVIFSKEQCPYCVDAKNVFDKIGQRYSVVDLNNHPEGGQFQDILKEMTGASTVPRVFVDGKCIGGGSDTVQLYKTGQLEQILKTDTVNNFESTIGRGENPADGF